MHLFEISVGCVGAFGYYFIGQNEGLTFRRQVLEGWSVELASGPDANISRLRKVSSPRILHLATHGFCFDGKGTVPSQDQADGGRLENALEDAWTLWLFIKKTEGSSYPIKTYGSNIPKVKKWIFHKCQKWMRANIFKTMISINTKNVRGLKFLD